MNRLLLLFFLGLSFPGYCQFTDNSIVIGRVDSLYSKILNEQRKFWIHVPNHENDLYQNKKYPVVFLLDGDEFFYSTEGTIRFLSRNGICPEMILVGIISNDRMHDLTPWHDTTVPKDSDMVRTSGGGELFTSFLERELIPYIESNYPAAPYRMMIGHSLGGLLTINTLINHTELFNAYVAIDPAIYWDNQRLLKQAKITLAQPKFKNRCLYMGLSGAMPNTDSLMKDKTLSTVYERSIIDFRKLIDTFPGNGLRYTQKYYEIETHNTVAFPATYDALHFIFDFLSIPGMRRDTVTTAFYIAHYKMISEKMGYTLLPPEDLINGMGYYYLQRKMPDRAYDFFQMNIENYPESYNVYDSMSDLYAAENNKEKAIEYLTKELTLKDLPYIRQKLNNLKKSK